MPREAHFSSEELAQVLSHYNIGVIHQVTPLSVGNKRAPKLILASDKGKFLLKRRQHGKDDLYRVAFTHTVQTHLDARSFPVASLIETEDEKKTILQIENHIYELFEFVTGARYNGSAEATIDAGCHLAKFHQYLSDFACVWEPLKGSFHDSSIVRRHLKMVGSGKKEGADDELRKIADGLMCLYNESSTRVNQFGFDLWSQQVVHGDWHPGNMLFSEHKLVAVLDFDSAKVAPPVTDLANGMLQFSIVGDRPNPADWPDYLDQARLVQFLQGYRQILSPDKYKLASLLDLMVETIIAEAVLPVATTGFFGNLSGLDFLKMISRKARWLDNNRHTLNDAINP
jgi:Ser/Thr protein kinase RdoA (MazF antagonist)